MSFANVNIGSGTSTGDGDSLRSAFNKINQNFANIADSRFDITIDAPVQSVNNQTGNVLLTVSDIAGATTPGYVDAKAEYAIATSRGYTDLSISNLLDSAPGALNTLNELAAAMGDDPNFAATVTNRLAAIETDLNTVRSESSGLLAQEITQLSNDLDDETARAISSEQALQSNINLISTTLSATEQTLQDNIDAETASRQNADAALQNNIDAETQARIVADDTLSARIDSVLANIDPAALDSFAEVVTAFQDADSNLNDAITALADTASTGLQDEIDRATAAEQTLQDNIDAESAARQTRDSELESGIDTVTADLVTEQTARTNADTALQANIDAEAASRAAADAALQANIDALSTTLTDYVDTEIAAIPVTDLTGLATETYVDTAVSNLVNGAGPALDTLNELAAALGNDENFATTVTNLVANVQANVDTLSSSLANVATSGSYTDLEDKPFFFNNTAQSQTLPNGGGSLVVNTVGNTLEFIFAPADVPTDVSDLTDTNGLLPSIDQVYNWDTAYGWGDHSAAGYVKNVNGNTVDNNGRVDITLGDVVFASQGNSGLAYPIIIPPNQGLITNSITSNPESNLVITADGAITLTSGGDGDSYITLSGNVSMNNAQVLGEISSTSLTTNSISTNNEFGLVINSGITVDRLFISQDAANSSIQGTVDYFNIASTGPLLLHSDVNLALSGVGQIGSVNGFIISTTLSAGDGEYLIESSGITFPDGTKQTTAFTGSGDTGNFTFSANTLGVSDANGGITINANGTGEIVMSDNVGIKQTNPGLALHIGSVNGAAPSEIGIAITAGNDTINGTASLQWDWHDGVGAGSNSTDTSQHAKFGIFKNGTLNHPWLTFDRLAPANALVVDSNGDLLVRGFKVTVIVNAPSSSIGQAGDSVGMIAHDATHYYYCTADYDGTTNIWKRLAWSGDTW